MAAKKKKKTNMGGSLLDLVEAEAEESALSGKNRAVLMEIREEIEGVLERGYKWRVVWQALHKAGRIEMGYDTFRAHCRAMGLQSAPKSYTKAKKASKPAKRRSGQ